MGPVAAVAPLPHPISKPCPITRTFAHLLLRLRRLLRGLGEIAVDSTPCRIAGSEGAKLNNTYLTMNAKVNDLMNDEGSMLMNEWKVYD